MYVDVLTTGSLPSRGRPAWDGKVHDLTEWPKGLHGTLRRGWQRRACTCMIITTQQRPVFTNHMSNELMSSRVHLAPGTPSQAPNAIQIKSQLQTKTHPPRRRRRATSAQPLKSSWKTIVYVADLVTPVNVTLSNCKTSANARNPNNVTTITSQTQKLEGKGGHLARTVGVLTLIARCQKLLTSKIRTWS